MVVTNDPELRDLTEEARLAALNANPEHRYTLAEHRAELDKRLEQRPEILARHRAHLVDLLVKDSDERAHASAQMSLLGEDTRIEDGVWALGNGLRVRVGDAYMADMQERATIRKANADRVLAAIRRDEAEDAALAPFFTSPLTTVAEARAAYLATSTKAA